MKLSALFLASSLLAPAALVRVEIAERSAILDGKAFGKAGAYERIIGKAYFAVDPLAAANRDVVNLGLAPRNGKGQVEFYADFVIFAPAEAKKSNGTLLFEVSNRGRKGLLATFSQAQASNDPRTAAEFGDGLLLEEGYTLAWLGWQFDVPREPPLMSVTVPVARKADGTAIPDGTAIQGVVRSDFVPDSTIASFSLGDRLFFPYRAVAGAAATLTERSLANGPRRVIPRGEWSFSEDRGAVRKASGFEAGKIYEVVYTSEDPPVVGLGMAGVRDFIAALRAGAGPGPLAALAPAARRSLAFGSSQSGRFLRTFLYQGFNRDEQGRQVFDGVWAHVAGGGRGNFNHQFAQPSRDARPFFNFYYATDIFPFTDMRQTDPSTGMEDGILARAERDRVVPKIFYTNSSYEYYGRAASLMHTTVDGRRDAPLAPGTRLYVIAGGNHGSGTIPPAPSANTRNLNNANDYQWIMRGLLAAMQGWLAENVEPPPSVYPRVDRGELATIDSVRFPDTVKPAPKRIHQVFRLDFGPEFRSRGIVAFEPPKMGAPYTMLLPQVDGDGNDIAGLKTPQVAVPLAAHTGWNLRNPGIGSPEELFSMTGSYFPFSKERIIERYRNRSGYLGKIRAAAQAMIGSRYILARDLPLLEALSAKEWDFVFKQ